MKYLDLWPIIVGLVGVIWALSGVWWQVKRGIPRELQRLEALIRGLPCGPRSKLIHKRVTPCITPCKTREDTDGKG